MTAKIMATITKLVDAAYDRLCAAGKTGTELDGLRFENPIGRGWLAEIMTGTAATAAA